jgi:hypothetical protein
MKVWKKYLIGLGVVVVGIQLVPVERENPPVTLDVGAPPEIDAILRRSCYDCHSNEVQWPWYAYVAPASWLVSQDVERGRELLNFSEWDRYDADMQISLVYDTYDVTDAGEMPLPIYLTMHGDAELTPDEIEQLSSWADAYEPPE